MNRASLPVSSGDQTSIEHRYCTGIVMAMLDTYDRTGPLQDRTEQVQGRWGFARGLGYSRTLFLGRDVMTGVTAPVGPYEEHLAPDDFLYNLESN